MKEFISGLTWVDYLTLIALLRGAYVGYRSGFFPELLRLVNYLACILAALLFAEPLGQYLTLKTFLNATTANTVSFTAILLGVFIAGKLLRIMILKLLKAGEGGLAGRLIGMVASVGRWVVLLSFLFYVIERSPLEQLKTDIHTRSYAGEQISKIAPVMVDYLSKFSAQIGPSKIAQTAESVKEAVKQKVSG